MEVLASHHIRLLPLHVLPRTCSAAPLLGGQCLSSSAGWPGSMRENRAPQRGQVTLPLPSAVRLRPEPSQTGLSLSLSPKVAPHTNQLGREYQREPHATATRHTLDQPRAPRPSNFVMCVSMQVHLDVGTVGS